MSSKKRLARYLQYNTSRKLNAVKFKESKAVFLFKVIPFLLHSNYEDLPGFIDDPECPYGIHLFQPEKVMSMSLFQRHFQFSTALRSDTASPYPSKSYIHSLKTIGSIGTIAQTEKSDCDYWVSIRFSELSPERLDLLREKCKLIEQWSARLGYEVYFFLMDIDQTRENSFESKAEDESAGSAIKLLLKDELFRTHILVAGKIPIWWLIPPGLSDEEYKIFVKELATKEKLNRSNFIDLGYISDLPKSEIFGACLWQMNKALDSPFKSVIKFAYLESLLSNENQALNLLSDKIKRLVTFPETLDKNSQPLEIANIDPYLLMAKEIVAFYHGDKEAKKRAEFIRTCLFMKTLEGMESKKKGLDSKNHLQTTMSLMKEWNLLPQNSQHYLNFHKWKYKDLIEAGAKVHEYLIDTYKRLRWLLKKFDKENNELTITDHDIAVLGRKLFTFHQKKPNKVEYINSLSREIMKREDITIHVARLDGEDCFFAFQGEHNHRQIKDNKEMIIKRDNHLLRLLSWLLINGIMTSETHLHLTKNYLPVDLTDIQTLVDKMINTFPKVNFSHISSSHLLKDEIIEKALAVINLKKELVKGTKNINAVIISANSYGEYFVDDYETLTQYKNALRTLLTRHEVSRWNNNLEVFIPPQPSLHAIQSMLDA